jgi:hypothetical protein
MRFQIIVLQLSALIPRAFRIAVAIIQILGIITVNIYKMNKIYKFNLFQGGTL